MLEVRGITRAFDGKPVLRGVDLTVGQGEIVCLLGPSGCGKTTLLRVIAGLERADSGDVIYDGASIVRTPVHERDFGFMFQDFALFPHLRVAENVGFGLKMHRAQDAQERVQEVIHLVGLEGFERREVGQLSGGEKQRVALARSLAPNPRLLMLDEPLGSLDAALRTRLVIELRHIIKSVGLTTIYVTHDQQEAFAIADRIALMNAGKMEQVDTPEAIYRRPATVFSAAFLGLNNIVPVDRYAHGTAFTALGTFALPHPAEAVLLHPLGIHLREDGQIEGRIEECTFQGDSYRLLLRHTSGAAITLKVPANGTHIPRESETARITIEPDYVLPLRGFPMNV